MVKIIPVMSIECKMDKYLSNQRNFHAKRFVTYLMCMSNCTRSEKGSIERVQLNLYKHLWICRCTQARFGSENSIGTISFGKGPINATPTRAIAVATNGVRKFEARMQERAAIRAK
jgi:hypothetical protein